MYTWKLITWTRLTNNMNKLSNVAGNPDAMDSRERKAGLNT